MVAALVGAASSVLSMTAKDEDTRTPGGGKAYAAKSAVGAVGLFRVAERRPTWCGCPPPGDVVVPAALKVPLSPRPVYVPPGIISNPIMGQIDRGGMSTSPRAMVAKGRCRCRR